MNFKVLVLVLESLSGNKILLEEMLQITLLSRLNVANNNLSKWVKCTECFVSSLGDFKQGVSFSVNVSASVTVSVNLC